MESCSPRPLVKRSDSRVSGSPSNEWRMETSRVPPNVAGTASRTAASPSAALETSRVISGQSRSDGAIEAVRGAGLARARLDVMAHHGWCGKVRLAHRRVGVDGRPLEQSRRGLDLV